jgi:tRNA threonylcarbamoyladenosine biosynthesis protein TsaB
VLIAAFDTATVAVSVALADADGLVARFDAPRQRRHAETLLPALDSVLALVDRSRHDITHLSVDVGPGMFTGLRVGVTSAITVAYALGLEVIPMGSLELLAWRLSLDGAFTGHVGATVDARRKECFVQPFAVNPGQEPTALATAMTVPPIDAAALLTDHHCGAVIGDGPLSYADAFVGFASIGPHAPDAATAAIVATRLLERALAPEAIALRYLREPDAEIPKDLRS